MFFFLSKLLPLFVYPLGLACLCLAGALLLLALRRLGWAAVAVAMALVLLLGGGNAWVANQLVKSLEWRYIPAAQLPPAEAIVVLGGGIKPPIFPRPWVDFAEAGDRVIHGIRLYQAGKAPLLVLSGGRVDRRSPPESVDMAAIATALGVPAEAILQDRKSLNTFQNAIHVRQLLAPKDIRRILLVTSAMHMPRALAVFRRQGFDPVAAATDFLVAETELATVGNTTGERLLLLIPQSDALENLTKALKEYIGIAVYRLRGWL